LSHAVEGAPAVALGAAVVWGILSIVLSPCHLSSIPLIVGIISGQGRTTTTRAFSVATVFAVGILITIGAVGAITAAAGRMMGDVGRWGKFRGRYLRPAYTCRSVRRGRGRGRWELSVEV
jgi:cytochrome c-type biogenesis protein